MYGGGGDCVPAAPTVGDWILYCVPAAPIAGDWILYCVTPS